MTTEEQKVMKNGLDIYRQALVTVAKQRTEAESELTEMTRLCAYYFRRYHDTRRAFIGCRMDKQDLERMIDGLTKQLGDKGLDINLGNDIPDVR